VDAPPQLRGLSELKVAGLTLRGIARGGVETCLMVPELRVMFDVGRCPPGALKYDTILCSHGHQDHLMGLPYLISQRGLVGKPPPVAHVPLEIVDPLHRILEAWAEIEGFVLPVGLHGHLPGEAFELGRDLLVHTLRTSHRVPSLAYLIERRTRRLKEQYRGRPGDELAQLRRSGVAISDVATTPFLCVTGDTRIDFFVASEAARRCTVLVHEVTAWDDRRDRAEMRQWGHTHVDEMIEQAERFEGEALVLVHRSERHSRHEAERVVRERFPASVRDRVHVFG
jgi:ribonuclease Z